MQWGITVEVYILYHELLDALVI